MLARAFEKDLQDKEKEEEKEKDALMQAALNDPLFQNKLNRIKGGNEMSGLVWYFKNNKKNLTSK